MANPEHVAIVKRGEDAIDGLQKEHSFVRLDLTKAGLSGINLTKANLPGANLSGANLTNANLWRATLRGTGL